MAAYDPVRRLIALDVLRGLMLVIIAIDHVGGPLRNLTWQTFGFVSAAEGFIFLSGFVSGLVYGRVDASGALVRHRAAYRRSLTIYLHHVAVLLLVLALAWAVPAFGARWQSWLGLPYESVPRTLLLQMLLVGTPHFMGVLPLYVLFLAATPVTVWLARTGRARWALGLSVLAWAAVQVGAPGRLSDVVPGLDPALQGKFAPLAWQLLFVGGCLLGVRRAAGQAVVLPARRGLVIAVVAACLALAAVRHGLIEVPGVRMYALTGRGALRWLRVVNFALLVCIVTWLHALRPGLFSSRWLAFLGRHSLQVFAWQVLALYLLAPVHAVAAQHRTVLAVIPALVLVASLAVPAWLHAAWKSLRAAPDEPRVPPPRRSRRALAPTG